MTASPASSVSDDRLSKLQPLHPPGPRTTKGPLATQIVTPKDTTCWCGLAPETGLFNQRIGAKDPLMGTAAAPGDSAILLACVRRVSHATETRVMPTNATESHDGAAILATVRSLANVAGVHPSSDGAILILVPSCTLILDIHKYSTRAALRMDNRQLAGIPVRTP